jgi:hypothetical protein
MTQQLSRVSSVHASLVFQSGGEVEQAGCTHALFKLMPSRRDSPGQVEIDLGSFGDEQLAVAPAETAEEG